MYDPSLLDPFRLEMACLAGPADAFEYRARGYRAQYRASRGNNPFPLIAAFGSLWARGFLRRAMQAGGVLAATHPGRASRVERWRRLTGFAAVDWPLVTAVARRPVVRFGFFPALVTLRFANFTSMNERIEQGRRAYDIAEAVGWPPVAESLDHDLARLGWQPAAVRAAACPLGGWFSPAPVLG